MPGVQEHSYSALADAIKAQCEILDEDPADIECDARIYLPEVEALLADTRR